MNRTRPEPRRVTVTADMLRTFTLEFHPRICLVLDMAGAPVSSIATLYNRQHLPELRFYATPNNVWIFHPDLRLRILSRAGDREWTCRIVRLSDVPPPAVPASIFPPCGLAKV